MALPAVAAVAARALPKIARGAGKLLRRGRGVPTPGAPAEEKEKPGVLSPAGMVMLTFGVLLDIASIICVILILAFGIGLVLAKIVYLTGLFITSLWALSRSGVTTAGKTTNPLMRFFKKQWKKLAFKAVPGIGDALPIWTWTIYSELKS